LRISTLGPIGSHRGFDAFWKAGQIVEPELAAPSAYPHHRLGADVGADLGAEVGADDSLHTLVEAAGWDDVHSRVISSARILSADELWVWLYGSLPLKTRNGQFLEGVDRDNIADALRIALEETLAPCRLADGRYSIESSIMMVSARNNSIWSCTCASCV
jgi:hypothetical protein